MYRLTPFTYLIEGLLANAMGGQQVRCRQEEFLTVVPPAGQDCIAFLEPFTAAAPGYAEVQANGDCGYCQVSRSHSAASDSLLTRVTLSVHER